LEHIERSIYLIRGQRVMLDADLAEIYGVVTISPDTTLEHLLCEILPRHQQASFLVAHQQRLHGIVALERLKSIPLEQWPQVTVRDVMLVVNRKMFVYPHTPLAEARALLMANEIRSAGVIDDQGYLVGHIDLPKIHKRLAAPQ
jgi:CBS domain-containing protein